MNSGLSGVTLTPKFVFGINGDIGLHAIDQSSVAYVAGNNVVIYQKVTKQ